MFNPGTTISLVTFILTLTVALLGLKDWLKKNWTSFWRKFLITLGVAAWLIFGSFDIFLRAFDSSHSTETIMSAIKKTERAKLTFCDPVAEMRTNPAVLPYDSGMKLRFHICNEGNDDATHIQDMFLVVGRANSKRLFVTLSKPQININSSVPIGPGGVLNDYPVPNLENPYFAYLKVIYINSKGEFPDTLRNIFFISGLWARDGYQDEFDSIKKALVEKNKW